MGGGFRGQGDRGPVTHQNPSICVSVKYRSGVLLCCWGEYAEADVTGKRVDVGQDLAFMRPGEQWGLEVFKCIKCGWGGGGIVQVPGAAVLLGEIW